MSAIFGATAKRLSTTLATGIAPNEHGLIACWYNRTVGATVFDDKLLELKSANIATGGQLRVENTTGPTIFASAIRGSSGRSAVQATALEEGVWRLAGGYCPPSTDVSGNVKGWDNGTPATLELPLFDTTDDMVAFSIGQGGNFNSYSFWHGRLAEVALFKVGSEVEADTIMAALGTDAADDISLPAGSTLLAYYPLLDDASAVVGPALTNNGSVTFDGADHPSLGGGGDPSVFANPFALLGVGRSA